MAGWVLLFHYESLRHNYLRPLFGFDLPKLKFLFPPAGWIMFYHVGEGDGRAEVYGFRGPASPPEEIDPHRIFETRWVGYDNLRRNILISVLDPSSGPRFCRYLARKFPEYGSFVVAQAWTPSVLKGKGEVVRQAAYRCEP